MANNKLNREKSRDAADERRDIRNRVFILNPFCCPSLRFADPWCRSCSRKNSPGFLFEFYDLNRILRNILPPKSRRSNRVSSWFYALFLWLYVWQLPCSPGIFVASTAIRRINSIFSPLLNFLSPVLCSRLIPTLSRPFYHDTVHSCVFNDTGSHIKKFIAIIIYKLNKIS